MKFKENNLLVQREITFLLFGTMLGPGVFSLPNTLAKDAYEAAWISVLIGAVYPLFLGGLGIFIGKNSPDKNILGLSKKYYGNIIGSILNFMFLIHFVIATSFIVSGFNNVYNVYAVSFLTPTKIVSIFTLLAAVAAYRGLKVLARVNSVTFVLSIILMALSFTALVKGSYLNLLPIRDVSFISIIKSSKESLYMYGGIEAIFLLYTSSENPKNIRKPVLYAVVIIAVYYTLVTAITIYYLGPDVVLKSTWSFIAVSESLNIPLINNFRYIYSFLWLGISANVISNFYYFSGLIAEELFKKVSRKKIFIFLYISVSLIAIRLSEVTLRSKVIDMLYGKMVLFVIAYITSIALFVHYKKDGEKS